MDYKEKYIAALEKLQEALAPTEDGRKISGLTRGCIENIFPELKESDGERIREAIKSGIRHLETQLGYDAVDGVDILDIYSWLEKQGEKPVDIDIESMISSYKQRLKSQGDIENTPLFDMCLTAFRHGIENVLEELNLKKLDPDKVIEWLKHCNITDFDVRTSIIPDSSPTSNPHRVRWFSEDFIDKFKKDFGL